MPAPVRRIVLFLGAGASAKAGVPPTFEFVEAFRRSLVSRAGSKNPSRKIDPKLVRVLDQLLKVLRRWKRRSSAGDDRVDVELLLEALTLAGSLKDSVASALRYGRPVAVVGKKGELSELLNYLQRFVREECYVGPYAAEFLLPLRRFMRENKPVHIFTVNYDMVMEQFLERNHRQYTDGFDLNWAPGNFTDDRFEAYLYKLHGSVTWFRAPNGSSLKFPLKLIQPRFPLATGGIAQPLMLYPAQKWINSGVYLRLLSLLHETLGVAEYAFVVGYSFRDDHFVRAFQEAASANPGLRLILVGPQAEEVYQKRLRYVQDPSIPDVRSSSELNGRVLRLPFLYENVIQGLYTVVWANLFDAVNSDVLALSQAEGGGYVAWHEVAMKYLEAGFLERPLELEESGIDWQRAGDSYPLEFYGRRAILLEMLGYPKEAGQAWERVRTQLRKWLFEELSFEFLGDWSIRLKLNTTPVSTKTPDQIISDIAGLTRFSRRYLGYLSDDDKRGRTLIQNILSTVEYLGEMPAAGLPFDSYVKSRTALAPAQTASFSKLVEAARASSQPATSMTEKLMAEFLEAERAYLLQRLPFLASLPLSPEGSN